MIPLAGDNPEPGTPIVTWCLIGVSVATFLWELSIPEAALDHIVALYGFVPAVLFGFEPAPAALGVPVWATVVTSMFLHGGFGHLLGNMLFLYIFGNNVEISMGRLRYLLFYLLCGMVAAGTQGLFAPTSMIPLIGASGAISGVLGAYLLLYPYARVRVLILFLPIPIFRILQIPAVIVLGFWFVLQFISALWSEVGSGGVAFWAHVSGFVAGVVLVALFKRADVVLFQRPIPSRFDFRDRTRDRLWGKTRDEEARRGDGRRGPWG